MATYSISNLRVFSGRQGGGYQASLLKDGVEVASVDDRGDGSAVTLRFRPNRDEENVFAEHVGGEENVEMYVYYLVNATDTYKKAKRKMRECCVCIEDTGVNVLSSTVTKNVDEIIREVEEKRPNAIVLNGLPQEEAVRQIQIFLAKQDKHEKLLPFI